MDEKNMVSYPIHIEIQPRVHLIRGANEARFPEANTLLIDDEIITLVDAGSNPDPPGRDSAGKRRLESSWLPRSHPAPARAEC